jgi:hypothetical protein
MIPVLQSCWAAEWVATVHAARSWHRCCLLHGAARRTRCGKPACLQACRPLLYVRDSAATAYSALSALQLLMLGPQSAYSHNADDTDANAESVWCCRCPVCIKGPGDHWPGFTSASEEIWWALPRSLHQQLFHGAALLSSMLEAVNARSWLGLALR